MLRVAQIFKRVENAKRNMFFNKYCDFYNVVIFWREIQSFKGSRVMRVLPWIYNQTQFNLWLMNKYLWMSKIHPKKQLPCVTWPMNVKSNLNYQSHVTMHEFFNQQQINPYSNVMLICDYSWGNHRHPLPNIFEEAKH